MHEFIKYEFLSPNINDLDDYLELNIQDLLNALRKLKDSNDLKYMKKNIDLVNKFLIYPDTINEYNLLNYNNYNILDNVIIHLKINATFSKYFSNLFNDIKHNCFDQSLYEISYYKLLENEHRFYLLNDKNNIDIENPISLNKHFISNKSINTICNFLIDPSNNIRSNAVFNLGLIGYPESLQSISQIINLLKDKDSSVKVCALWSLGEIACKLNDEVLKKIIDCINTNKILKVKYQGLHTICKFDYKFSNYIAIYLISLLMNISFTNKYLVSRYLIFIGNYGELKLINYFINLYNTNNSNIKLQKDILSAFSYINLNSLNLNTIIKLLYYSCESNHSIIRLSALRSLHILNIKINNKINSFYDKKILNLLYLKLTDEDSNIRKVIIY